MALIPGNIKPGVATLWNKYYPTHNYDDFRRVLYNHVRPNHVVLEIGAGSGMGNQQSFFLREHVSKYVWKRFLFLIITLTWSFILW
jgi:hypothetical protein